MQFVFSEEHRLTINRYTKGKLEKILKTDNWKVVLKGSRHFLLIENPVMSYEVVTINHTVMVLVEDKTMDKVFCAYEPFWEDHLKSNKTITL